MIYNMVFCGRTVAVYALIYAEFVGISDVLPLCTQFNSKSGYIKDVTPRCDI